MKKLFTLFAAALVGLAAFAQEPCPTKMEMQLQDASDPANVFFEFVITQNNSLNLNGFNMEITKPGDAVWKRAQGANWVTAKGYASYILERINLDGLTAADFTEDELEDMLSDFLDNKSNVKNGSTSDPGSTLAFIPILSTNECRFYPDHAGAVGKAKVDMSALADGEYEFRAEATPPTCSFSYTGGPEGTRAWTSDEPVVMTLKKEGDVITQITETPPEPVVEYEAFYVTGTFNEWSQDVANMTELVSNEDGTQFSGELDLTDGAEFKVVSPLEDGLKWFGGADENQIGYFEINDDMLNQPIELVDGSNFKVVGDGKYTITIMQATTPDGKALAEPLVMTVTKEETPEPPVVEYSEFYVVGTFNEWSQEDGMVQLEGNEEGTQYIGQVQLVDGAEFKVIAPVEDGWKWFGGADENQVGYFEINDGVLNQPIELVDGSNFKVVGDGKYTITVMQPTTPDGKALAEPLVMTVSKETTGIDSIAIDNVDNRIFDLQGRELKSVPEHGIYIQNGKKYVK